MSDVFLIKSVLKQRDALSPLLFKLCFRLAVKRAQVKQDGLKLNGTYHILFYADDVNVFCGRVHTLENFKDALVFARKETGLEVNADKTKYMVMS